MSTLWFFRVERAKLALCDWVGEGNYRNDLRLGMWVRCGDAFTPVQYIRAGDLVEPFTGVDFTNVQPGDIVTSGDVFVYGTLKTGGPLWGHHLRPRIGVLDSLAGWDLYNMGHYPAIVPTEDTGHWVHGEVFYDVPPELIEQLDRAEGVPDLYTRQRHVTTGGRTVWVYVMAPDQVRGKKRLPSGRWTSPSITEGLADFTRRLVQDMGGHDAAATTIREDIRPLATANGAHIPWRTGPMKTEAENTKHFLKWLERAAEIGL